MSECDDVLSQCHIHVALKGSQFANEGTVRYLYVRFWNNSRLSISLWARNWLLFCNKALDLFEVNGNKLCLWWMSILKNITFFTLLLVEWIEREKNKPLTLIELVLYMIFYYTSSGCFQAASLCQTFVPFFIHLLVLLLSVCRSNAWQRENGADVEVRVYQPTMSSANMVVGDIISGVSTWCKGQMKTLNRTKLTFDIFVGKIQKEAHDLLLKLFLLLIATNVLVNSRAPKLRKSTHPRKFGNHVTVHRPSFRTTGNQCLISYFLASLGAQENW